MVTPSNGATSSVWIAALISIIVGCALLIGILTPIAGLAATSGYLVRGFTLLLSRKAGMHDGTFPCIDLAVISLALVLLGPGLYSLDARLFGRREIIIPGGRRPPL